MDTFNTPDQIHEYYAPIEPWGGVTNPEHHDSSRFRYLTLPLTDSVSSDGPIKDGDARMTILPYSLIDQDHPPVAPKGIIVEVPENNILATNEKHTAISDKDHLRIVDSAFRYGVMDGETLLRYTNPKTPNQVIVAVHINDREKVTKGIYATSLVDDTTRSDLIKKAQEMNVPFITLTDDFAPIQKYTHDDNIDVERLRVQEEEPLPTRSEMQSVIAFALSTKRITEKQAERIARDFEEAERSQEQPRVEFNPDGSVHRIYQVIQYPSHVYLAQIGQNGTGYERTVSRQPSRQANGNAPEEYMMPLRPHKAIQMTDSACASLGADERAAVERWLAERMPRLRSRWDSYENLSTQQQ